MNANGEFTNNFKRAARAKGTRCARKALVLCALLLGMLLLLSVGTEAKYGGIYDKTVRLHVLADSNEAQAQALKLKVRDDLLALLEEELADCTDRRQAEERLRILLPALEECAARTLKKEGCALSVTLSLEEEEYPLRVYEGCTFPEGEYLSLRVFIGSGEGRNWWCVVYPPLCLSSSLAQSNDYTEDEQALLTGNTEGYKLKLAFLEVGRRIVRLFR